MTKEHKRFIKRVDAVCPKAALALRLGADVVKLSEEEAGALIETDLIWHTLIDEMWLGGHFWWPHRMLVLVPT